MAVAVYVASACYNTIDNPVGDLAAPFEGIVFIANGRTPNAVWEQLILRITDAAGSIRLVVGCLRGDEIDVLLEVDRARHVAGEYEIHSLRGFAAPAHV